jgi:hypothetical protein
MGIAARSRWIVKMSSSTALVWAIEVSIKTTSSGSLMIVEKERNGRFERVACHIRDCDPVEHSKTYLLFEMQALFRSGLCRYPAKIPL